MTVSMSNLHPPDLGLTQANSIERISQELDSVEEKQMPRYFNALTKALRYAENYFF